jgi:hypothetical protein
MNTQALIETANALGVGDKSLLAMDVFPSAGRVTFTAIDSVFS